MLSRDSIETAYCFFHQKERVYAHSTLPWQMDDIEYAIAQYVESMSPELLDAISAGRDDFLRSHASFHADICLAVERLEAMMGGGR